MLVSLPKINRITSTALEENWEKLLSREKTLSDDIFHNQEKR